MKNIRIIFPLIFMLMLSGTNVACSGDKIPMKIDVDKDKGGEDDGDEGGGDGGDQTPQPVVPDIDKGQLLATLTKVADWQIANHSYVTSGNLHDHGINAWTHATFYNGMFAWSRVAPSPARYHEWLFGIGEKAAWQVPANFLNSSYKFYHADELCIGQFYLSMYGKYGDAAMYASVKERIDRIIADPPSVNMGANIKQSWTWCDALYMAPPVYARIAALEGDDKYTDFMDMLYMRTYNYLFDTSEGLFFRDDSYFGKVEANGRKVFWGRGNGWVAAGLANILELLPEGHPSRTFYEDLFGRLILRLTILQDNDGFWHASLLDPESYPSPETSASAMITYAIAFGVRKGLLDAETYVPVLEKSWEALQTVVADDGKVGYVQPIGQDPKNVTKDMTAVYGVGAFLMAGSEIARLLE